MEAYPKIDKNPAIAWHEKSHLKLDGLILFGGKVELRSLSRQEVSYALLPGSPCWARTSDPLINSQML